MLVVISSAFVVDTIIILSYTKIFSYNFGAPLSVWILGNKKILGESQNFPTRNDFLTIAIKNYEKGDNKVF